MLLASNFILNHSSESGPIEIYPWIHSLNNTISSATQLAKITIPSKPLKSPLTKMSMIAGDFASIYHKDTHSFPCIVTQYFIDTQPNLLDLISQLHSLIPSGKYWINIGPLEYHFENLEFTQNEVRVLIQNQGFEIMIEDFNQESYTADFESMRKDLYNCWFFVARKI
jgi:carnosine N-methyltransferase